MGLRTSPFPGPGRLPDPFLLGFSPILEQTSGDKCLRFLLAEFPFCD